MGNVCTTKTNRALFSFYFFASGTSLLGHNDLREDFVIGFPTVMFEVFTAPHPGNVFA